MILTETKITYHDYCGNRLGNDVVCPPVSTTAVRGIQGILFLVFRDKPQGWSVEATHFHGPNVVSCEVIIDGQLTLIIGAYLPTSTFDK